jgi:hypothetical protein
MLDYPSLALGICLAALACPTDTSPAVVAGSAECLEELLQHDPGLVARCQVRGGGIVDRMCMYIKEYTSREREKR